MVFGQKGPRFPFTLTYHQPSRPKPPACPHPVPSPPSFDFPKKDLLSCRTPDEQELEAPVISPTRNYPKDVLRGRGCKGNREILGS